MPQLTPTEIDHAVSLLRHGQLVAFPTETVYGLGADARNPEAIARLFAAKGRPTNHPVIVHVAEVLQLSEWVSDWPASPQQACPDWLQPAMVLAQQAWPGPLTMVLPKAAHVLDAVTGGQPLVGVRVPSHPVAQQFLAAFGDGVVAPSANPFGAISPTTAAHVRAGFSDYVVPLVLDGGACPVGIESTIVAITPEAVTLLRPGHYAADTVAAWVSPVLASGQVWVEHASSTIRVSGGLDRHYSPQKPTWRLSAAQWGAFSASTEEGIGVMTFAQALPNGAVTPTRHLDLTANPETAAQQLYAALHSLDADSDVRTILIAPLPEAGSAWAGVEDRLRRASQPWGG